MTLNEMFSIVYNLYDALMKDDFAQMLSLLAENVRLEWGPFVFEGKERVHQWGRTLKQMFTEVTFGLDQLTMTNNGVSHNLMMRVTVPGGRKGIMKAIGTYTFSNGALQNITVSILEGILLVTKEELSLERYF
jgi:hypothetical protein